MKFVCFFVLYRKWQTVCLLISTIYHNLPISMMKSIFWGLLFAFFLGNLHICNAQGLSFSEENQDIETVFSRELGDKTMLVQEYSSPDLFSPDAHCHVKIRIQQKRTITDSAKFEYLYVTQDGFGLIFPEEQPVDNQALAVVVGNYTGNIILADEQGKMSIFRGSNFILTKDKKYLIAPWATDLPGVTIIDLEKKEAILEQNIDFTAGIWYELNGKYYVKGWDDATLEESDEVFQMDFAAKKIKKVTLNPKLLKPSQMAKLEVEWQSGNMCRCGR